MSAIDFVDKVQTVSELIGITDATGLFAIALEHIQLLLILQFSQTALRLGHMAPATGGWALFIVALTFFG